MDEKTLKEMILEQSEGGTLSCEDAHRIARELEVSLAEIGRICNHGGEKIKIIKCLLGCF